MVSNDIFAGEIMTCVVCAKQQRSNPESLSNWRCLEIDGDRCYACPDEFPPDRAGKKAFKTAYQFVIACSLNEILKRSNKPPNAEVESARLAIIAKRQQRPRGFDKRSDR